MNKTKQCKRCLEFKPLNIKNFSPHNGSPDGWQYNCHPCTKILFKEGKIIRESRYITVSSSNGDVFKIRRSDYDHLLDSQNGVCAICHLPERGTRRLAVDHCHFTGKIRGLLCSNCNGKLGWFETFEVDIENYLKSSIDIEPIPINSVGDKNCDWCDKPLPFTARYNQRFCSNNGICGSRYHYHNNRKDYYIERYQEGKK